MKPFKGRRIDRGRQVWVYRNLRGGGSETYSIMQGGLVCAHSGAVDLDGVTCVVRRAGRERVIREGKKNVHAFVVGTLRLHCPPGRLRRAGYNPYKTDMFAYLDDSGTWRKFALADSCHLDVGGLSVVNPK